MVVLATLLLMAQTSPEPVSLPLPVGWAGLQARVSSPFGERILRGKPDFHEGVDFRVEVGTHVLAVQEGIVRRVWYNVDRNGFAVSIISEGGYIWWSYVHLDCAPFVAVGDRVRRGQVIGLSGNTGDSTGPHLHLGAWVLIAGGKRVARDPMSLISSRALMPGTSLRTRQADILLASEKVQALMRSRSLAKAGHLNIDQASRHAISVLRVLLSD